jgi:hypothetical protein
MLAKKVSSSVKWALVMIASASLLSVLVLAHHTFAITQIPTPPPQPGSYGIEATKLQPPPTVPASIATPGSGASYSNSSTITVTGVCQSDLLVEIYDNSVLVGSVLCKNGSYTIQVSLFVGQNQLSAVVYDDIGQAGPASNLATVAYNNANITSFGQLVTLTSTYGRLSAAAGSALTWPLQLSGGAGPYAVSIDWGDGSKADLKSQSLAGQLDIAHVYKNAGIYQVNVQVTDSTGVSAFIQLVAVANGKPSATAGAASGSSSTGATKTQYEVLWIPTIIALILMLPAYWLGRRSQLVSIRNKLDKERDSYKENIGEVEKSA